MSQKLKTLYKEALLIEEKLKEQSLQENDRVKFCELLDSCDIKKLEQLSIRVKTGMNLPQFICFVVPIERELNKKITDSEVLIETEDSKSNELKKNDLIIVLDNIRSPFNMGAIVRTCDALGVSELIVTGYTPDLDDERVKKISMGAWKNVPAKKFRHLNEAVNYLKEKSYDVVAVETAAAAVNISDAKLNVRTALVFGNERFGISEADLGLCSKIVKLPMFGMKNSLNINAALAACGYEWVKQNGQL